MLGCWVVLLVMGMGLHGAEIVVSAAVPKVVAKRVIVVDDTTGRVLYEKNSRQKCAVASTQKLLTALCVVAAGPLDDIVSVKSTDTRVEPSKLYLHVGERYKRGDLLKALLVKSGNDAARALARDVAGSQVRFARLMNAKAKQLGMRDSHFVNAHGLTVEGQYSTARDIAILARNVTRNPFLANIVKVKGYYFKRGKRRKWWLDNTNKLLKKLPYVTGMKTGTTRASGRCLVCSAERHGKKVIVVCLGSDSKHIWQDSEKLVKWALGVKK